MSKKSKGPFSQDFLDKDIKVGDWVHLAAFNMFAKVKEIIPRYDYRGGCRQVPDGVQFNPRTMIARSPLIRVAARSSCGLQDTVERLQFGDSYSDSVDFCAGHCEKLTPELRDRYLGWLVRRYTQQLMQIPL